MRWAWHLWIVFMLALTGFTRSGWVRPASAGPGPEADTVLVIRAFQFRPKSIEVPVGTRIVWSNEDEIEHTVTSGDGERSDGQIDGRLAGKGESFGVTFGRPGTVTYFCSRHHFMRGEVRVIQPTKETHQ